MYEYRVLYSGTSRLEALAATRWAGCTAATVYFTGTKWETQLPNYIKPEFRRDGVDSKGNRVVLWAHINMDAHKEIHCYELEMGNDSFKFSADCYDDAVVAFDREVAEDDFARG